MDNLFDEVRAIFEFPVYAVSESGAMLHVDKLTLDDAGAMARKRYFVVPGVQCSCLGWMKFGSCKHLQMVAGEYAWVGDGVPAAYVTEETERIVAEVGARHFPESVDGWRVDATRMPDLVRGVEFQVRSSEAPKKMQRLIGVKKFADGGRLAIALIFDQKKVAETASKADEEKIPEGT